LLGDDSNIVKAVNNGVSSAWLPDEEREKYVE